MYTDVLRLTIILVFNQKTCTKLLLGERRLLLPLARRQSQTRFHPLDQSALAITNAAAELRKWWAVARHPSLGQPRRADAQEIGRFLWGEQTFGAV